MILSSYLLIIINPPDWIINVKLYGSVQMKLKL